jgi:ABC-type lipoprotein release transport system permease subunit
VSRLLGGLLYEVRPHDPSVLTGIVIFLLAVTLAASWLPARSASRVDPVVALRED